MEKVICIGTNSQFGLTDKQQIQLFCKTGFDGAFANWSRQLNVGEFADELKSNSMIFQSIHAPFDKMADVWAEDVDKAKVAIDELKACLEDCIKYEVPIMVAHAFIGFDDHSPTQIGIDRIGELVALAENSGVKIAFENTEGIEYLDAITKAFIGSEAVGFCWDSGHEMCYNHSNDMLAKYGDRLLCTHLNDNLGISDKNGKIFWTDDLHLLPFDGIAGWDNIVHRLEKVKFEGPLTFELNTLSRPNRHENDKYSNMPIETYISEVYLRACKIYEKFA